MIRTISTSDQISSQIVLLPAVSFKNGFDTFSHALDDIAIRTFEPSLVLISDAFIELEHDSYAEDRIVIINLCREEMRKYLGARPRVLGELQYDTIGLGFYHRLDERCTVFVGQPALRTYYHV